MSGEGIQKVGGAQKIRGQDRRSAILRRINAVGGQVINHLGLALVDNPMDRGRVEQVLDAAYAQGVRASA